MAKGRRFETRVYNHPLTGDTYEYTVYFVEDRDSAAIEESETIKLGLWAGCKDLHVSKPIQVAEDRMFWQDWQVKKNPDLPKAANRYIAYYGCTGPDGNFYEDIGSAAPDNIQMNTMRTYEPEMAIKRARVRCILLALGLKDLNADVEFPDGDKNVAKENVEETTKFLKDLSNIFDAKNVPQDSRKEILGQLKNDLDIKTTNVSLLSDKDRKKLLDALTKYNVDEAGIE